MNHFTFYLAYDFTSSFISRDSSYDFNSFTWKFWIFIQSTFKIFQVSPKTQFGIGDGVNFPVSYLQVYEDAGGNSYSTPSGQLKLQLISFSDPEQRKPPLKLVFLIEHLSTEYWHCGPLNVFGHWQTLWKTQEPPLIHEGLQVTKNNR